MLPLRMVSRCRGDLAAPRKLVSRCLTVPGRVRISDSLGVYNRLIILWHPGFASGFLSLGPLSDSLRT
jgi:hypothetical protein